jgi:hypothetical protein
MLRQCGGPTDRSAPNGVRVASRVRAAVVVLLSLGACGISVNVDPGTAVRRVPNTQLSGRLRYSGPPEYVPRILRDRADAERIFLYSLESSTQRTTFSALSSLFPLGLLGVPTGETVATVSARLEIRLGSRMLGAYDATARASKLRGVYLSDATDELTRRAGLAARDDLDAQLINDLPTLSGSVPR